MGGGLAFDPSFKKSSTVPELIEGGQGVENILLGDPPNTVLKNTRDLVAANTSSIWGTRVRKPINQIYSSILGQAQPEGDHLDMPSWIDK